MSVCCRVTSKEKTVPVVATVCIGALFIWAVMTSALALYCRAEWLATAREFNHQRDMAHAAEISAEYWFQKYRVREWSRPGASERDVVAEMAARHRELRRKVEKETAKRNNP